VGLGSAVASLFVSKTFIVSYPLVQLLRHYRAVLAVIPASTVLSKSPHNEE
jgi:hypothetical protein